MAPQRALAACLLTAVCGLSVGGCASSRGGAGVAADGDSGSSETVVEAPLEARQGLFRVRFRGVDGRGRIRLTMRAAVGGDFTLAASDTFGRALWSFESRDGRSLLLDHRASEYCRLEGDVVVRAVALSDLAVSTLPRVLIGELPVPPSPVETAPTDGEQEFRSVDGRRWTARYEGGALVTWTLWSDGAPLVWWRAEPDGGILSHRDGAQALWKTVALERDPEALEALEIPQDYQQTRCDGDDLS